MPRALLLLSLLCAACAAPEDRRAEPFPSEPAPTATTFELSFEPPGSGASDPAELESVFTNGCAEVARFFGHPFPGEFEVMIVADRATFEAVMPPEWGLAHTECWMVAAGWGGGVIAIDPRVWGAEACEHDPDDAGHVRRLLTHELVHVYHCQHGPSPDGLEFEGLDWFVEGLATYASGQLAEEHAEAARSALAEGVGPRALATAWTGPYRYGVSGSLVAFLDHDWGRDVLVELLGEIHGDRLLERLGVSEAEFLERWRAWVTGSAR